MCTLSDTGILSFIYADLKSCIAVLYPGIRSKPKHVSFTRLKALNAAIYGMAINAV